jgi:hypothetical protein
MKNPRDLFLPDMDKQAKAIIATQKQINKPQST